MSDWAIGSSDPASIGVARRPRGSTRESRAGWGRASEPVARAGFVPQIRATEGGAEKMSSRFFINHVENPRGLGRDAYTPDGPPPARSKARPYALG